MSDKAADKILVQDLERLLEEDGTITLIDARTPEEFAEGHVPGAINIPIPDLAEFARSRDNTSDSLIVTMCGSAGRGEKAAAILDTQGVSGVQVLEGGLKAWRDAGLSVA